MARIIVIDDEASIAIMIKRMLEKEGYEVEIAFNGNEGLKLLEKFQPDLLITDIVMPEKEGLELIIELKKVNPSLKIVAISGGGRFKYEGYLSSAKHLGASKVFQKPLNFKEFIAGISELLNEKNLPV